jgi:hypothetical protein
MLVPAGFAENLEVAGPVFLSNSKQVFGSLRTSQIAASRDLTSKFVRCQISPCPVRTTVHLHEDMQTRADRESAAGD